MTSNSSAASEEEVRRRVKEMRDEDLVHFVRETITRLDALADRLEMLATGESLAHREETGRDARDA